MRRYFNPKRRKDAKVADVVKVQYRALPLMNEIYEPKYQRMARKTAGTLFVAAGLFKLLAARGEFAHMLAWAHVPLPQVVSFAVPLLEVGGGAALCTNRKTRIFAALLAGDMAAAIFLVGVPGRRGHAFTAQGHTVGAEVWRLPLEIVLLVICLWLAWKQKDAASKVG